MKRSSLWVLGCGLWVGGCATTEVKPKREAPPMAATQPAERVIEIGRSVEDRPVLMHLFGGGPHPILVLGGIHGSEKNSADCAALLVEQLRGHRVDQPIAVIPAANPDGLARGVRMNAHRVDLNRNLPAKNWTASKYKGTNWGGPSAGSEPETQALIKAIESLQPARILSIHSITSEPCNNYDGPAEPLAKLMTARNGYVARDTIGYPTPGSLGSWAGIDRQIPMITLELPHNLPGKESWEHNRDAILVFITGM
jgi:murein peptide amidase A